MSWFLFMLDQVDSRDVIISYVIGVSTPQMMLQSRLQSTVLCIEAIKLIQLVNTDLSFNIFCPTVLFTNTARFNSIN